MVPFNDLEKSETVFCVAYIHEPFDSQLNASESCDLELTLVGEDATVNSRYGNLDPEINPPFLDGRVTVSTSARNYSVQDLRSGGKLINCEVIDTLDKNVSCVSQHARPKTVTNHAKGSMDNLDHNPDAVSVKQTVLADLTSSLNVRCTLDFCDE